MYWLRIGDNGEYESFDDLAGAIDRLAGAGLVLGWVAGGVQTEAYRGNNYVSFFWGDDCAELIRHLNKRERTAVEQALKGNHEHSTLG
jgi:hypothetical protein